MPLLQRVEVGTEGRGAAQALTSQFLPGRLDQHHPAAETPPRPLMSRRKLGGESTTKRLDLAGKLVGTSNCIGFLVMDPGGPDQGRILERPTQVEERALRGQPQPEGVAFPA